MIFPLSDTIQPVFPPLQIRLQPNGSYSILFTPAQWVCLAVHQLGPN